MGHTKEVQRDDFDGRERKRAMVLGKTAGPTEVRPDNGLIVCLPI